MRERLRNFGEGSKRSANFFASGTLGLIVGSALAQFVGPEAAAVIGGGGALSLDLLVTAIQNRGEAKVRIEEGWYKAAESKLHTSNVEFLGSAVTACSTLVFAATRDPRLTAYIGPAAGIVFSCIPIHLVNEDLINRTRSGWQPEGTY